MAVTWNESTAAHLLRRAAFGGSAAEIAQAVSDGLNVAVSKLLNYDGITTGDLDLRLQRQTLDLTTTGGIQQWWATRLLYSPRQLEERMTLFWHDHFATGISKVGSATMMLDQNKLIRSYATGNFINFTIDMSKDPAMLVWLDNRFNRKGRPNENYGRELLELFTLGIGNYAESDVDAAARAFTGWTLDSNGKFVFNDANHDHTQKTFLGQTGDFNGDDIVRIACRTQAHGRFLVRKLFEYFAHSTPTQALIDSLAQTYLNSGNNVKALVEAILKSDEMYSPAAIRTKVTSPIDHAVIASRQLLIDHDTLDNDIINSASTQGMALFNPPSVGGWTTGLGWVNANAILSRINLARVIIARGFDVAKFLSGATVSTPAQMVDEYLKRLGPITLPAATRTLLINYVAPDGVTMPTGSNLNAKQRVLPRLIVSLPEWQMH